jgi:hypothetical protein
VTLTGAFVVVAVVLFLIFRDRPPPPVVHRVATKGPIQIFPASRSALIIPPDGSLWHWGLISIQPAAHAPVPQRVGTETNWVFATGSYSRYAAIKGDGTLWQWGTRGTDLNRTLTKVNADTNWTTASAGTVHTLALKTDGTLWAWGQNRHGQLGVPGDAPRHEPVQVGRDNDWIAVAADQGNRSHGIKADGTLWVWGLVYWPPGRTTLGGRATIPAPVQFGRDTNWVGFVHDMVRNDGGELWTPLGPADATLRKEDNARFVVALNGDSVFPLGVSTEPSLSLANFKVSKEGQLFARHVSDTPNGPWRLGAWHPFDDRRPWTHVYGNRHVTLGVTRDGTIWTWGTDPGFPDTLSNKTRVQNLKQRLESAIGNRVPRRASNLQPRIQKYPRAIMRVETPNKGS